MIVISPVYVPAGSDVAAVTLTVIVFDVLQQPAPWGEICNQAPPVPLTPFAEKLRVEVVLEIVRDCDGGLLPPADIEKLRETGAATKPGSPTTTLTGTVTQPPAEENRTWPV